MPHTPVSVLLPTFNNAATVRDTLESIKWADEILVVDSYSSDDTLAICAEYGARIIQHEYVNSAKQKNWALPQCRHEWVLQIDTDEVFEPGLRDEIEAAVAAAGPEVDAFRLPRRNHFLGRWVRFGDLYPDHQIRVLRRDRCRWAEREVHAHVEAQGEVGTLSGCILHYGAPNLSKQVGNLNRYSRYEADEMAKRGTRFRWHHLVIRPWLVFAHRYVLQQGFRDGWRGFILCVYYAVYVFLSRAKLWELEELGLNRSPR